MAASSSSVGASTSYLDRKAEEINLVLSEPEVDLWKLRELALTEGGLVNDTLRKRAWPKLVGLHDFWVETLANETSATRIEAAVLNQDKENSESSSYNLRSRPPRPPAAQPSSTSNVTTKSEADAGDITDTEGDDEDENQSVSSNASSTVLVPGSSSSNNNNANNEPSCRDADQIDRDVTRCTWHLLTGNQRLQRLQMEHKRNRRVRRVINRKQQRLATLLSLTLLKSYESSSSGTKNEPKKELRYYQGYHDVACIFLSSLGGTSRGRVAAGSGLELPSAVLYQVSQSHFLDCLAPNFASLQTALRLSLFPLIAVLDPDVHEHLFLADMEPFFALSWILTWYAHDVRDTDAVKRLFDGFLVSHPLLPVYMAVAMVLHPVNRLEVLAAEPQFSEVHHTLAHLPKNSSMVGWKYRPGDGYVSDDEQPGDESGTVSTDALSMDGEFFLVDGNNANQQAQRSSSFGLDNDETTSLVSTCLSSMEPPARVPFQELLDTAIRYMRRYPPRKLIPLAKRYYGSESVARWLRETPVIHMFQPPPAWALQSTAPADWVLKQRARERRGLTAQSRRDRRREKERQRSRSRSRETRSGEATNDGSTRSSSLVKQEDMDALLAANRYDEKKLTMSMIAMGFGPGDDEERRRRKRRRLMVCGAVVLAVLTVAVGVTMYSRPSALPPTAGQETSSETKRQQPSERLLEVSTTERQEASSVQNQTQPLPSESVPNVSTVEPSGEITSTAAKQTVDSTIEPSREIASLAATTEGTNQTILSKETEILNVTVPADLQQKTAAGPESAVTMPVELLKETAEALRETSSHDDTTTTTIEPVGFREFAGLLGRGVRRSVVGFVQDPRAVQLWKDVSQSPLIEASVRLTRAAHWTGLQKAWMRFAQEHLVDLRKGWTRFAQEHLTDLRKGSAIFAQKHLTHLQKESTRFAQECWTGLQKGWSGFQEHIVSRAESITTESTSSVPVRDEKKPISFVNFTRQLANGLRRSGQEVGQAVKQTVAQFTRAVGATGGVLQRRAIGFVRHLPRASQQMWKDVSGSHAVQSTARTLHAASFSGLYDDK